MTMTAEQTARYDSTDDRTIHELLAEVRAEAQRLANESGENVEVYTHDGSVATIVEPA